ncbi:MAG: gamma-glutamylcyclotransferase family protein [Polyangiaceae bacterium]
MTTFPLFVCGTFLSGEREHDLLAGTPRRATIATAKGYTLVEVRALAALLEGGAGAVVGELYDVSYDVLRACDKRRDHPALFHRKDVRLADGSIAQGYFLRDDQARGLRRIHSGDFRARFAVAKPEPGPFARWAKGRHTR